MPRLFTGLQIPPEIADELVQFRGGLSGARWVEPADFHITLCFIGDIDLSMAREIDAELAAVNNVRVDISIAGLESFGGKKPRSLVAKVKASAGLAVLQKAHDRAVRLAGGAVETRKYIPHVTVARLRNVPPLAVADYLHARSIAKTWRFTAEEFVLFSARDSVGGGPYQVEATYPLRAETPVLRPATSQ